MAMEASYKAVAEGIAHLNRIDAIRRQLAPTQRVLVFESGGSGQEKQLKIRRDLPGRGYLSDPEQTTITPVAGVSEICYIPDLEPSETEEFIVEGRSIRLEESDDYDDWHNEDFDDSTLP